MPVPYTRLARNTSAAPTPQQVGALLQQRMGGMGGEPGAPPADYGMGADPAMMADSGMGSPPMEPMGAPGGMGAGPMAPAMMGMGMRLPAQGMAGDYDPQTEHSPSSTRSSLENTMRFLQSKLTGSEVSMAPRGTREQLLRLGIPPAELEGYMQTGRFGDDAQSMGG